MNEDLAEVANQQHGKDPTVNPADTSTHGLHQGHVEAHVPIIVGEKIVPVVVNARPLTPEERTVEIDLHDP
jgi:hypothetical protein